jgi:hypothetical protein
MYMEKKIARALNWLKNILWGSWLICRGQPRERPGPELVAATGAGSEFTPNEPSKDFSCHSEHSEESHNYEKRRDPSLRPG